MLRDVNGEVTPLRSAHFERGVLNVGLAFPAGDIVGAVALASPRASLGVHPTRALNIRLKCDRSENPQVIAISAILRLSAPALCSSRRA